MCNERYDPFQAKMLGANGDSHLWYVMCQNCLNSLMIVVLFGDFGVKSVGVLTDLTFEDVLRFKQTSPISVDDILNLHTTL